VIRKCLCSLVPVKDDFISLSHSSLTPRTSNGTDNHLLQTRLQSRTWTTSATTPTNPTARASRHDHGPNRTTSLASLARKAHIPTVFHLHPHEALPPPLPPERTPAKDIHSPPSHNPPPLHPSQIRAAPPHPSNHHNPRHLPPRNKPTNPNRSILRPLPPPLHHQVHTPNNNNLGRTPPWRNKPTRLLPFPTHILDLPVPPHRTAKPGFHHPLHPALPTRQYHVLAASQEAQDVDPHHLPRPKYPRLRSSNNIHPPHPRLPPHRNPPTNPPHLSPFKHPNRHTHLLHRRPYNSNHIPPPQYRVSDILPYASLSGSHAAWFHKPVLVTATHGVSCVLGVYVPPRDDGVSEY